MRPVLFFIQQRDEKDKLFAITTRHLQQIKQFSIMPSMSCSMWPCLVMEVADWCRKLPIGITGTKLMEVIACMPLLKVPYTVSSVEQSIWTWIIWRFVLCDSGLGHMYLIGNPKCHSQVRTNETQ